MNSSIPAYSPYGHQSSRNSQSPQRLRGFRNPTSQNNPKSPSSSASPSPSKRDIKFRNSGSATLNSNIESEYKKIPICFSVFFGNPDPESPRLDHARFHAEICEEIFKNYQRIHNPTGAPLKNQVSPPEGVCLQERVIDEGAVFQNIVELALTFTNEILNSLREKHCTVCKTEPAQALVHRPLCATRAGYLDLGDFESIRHLMLTIASHTEHITQKEEVDWSISGVLSARPYLCHLAVPICSRLGDCHKMATQRTQEYLEGIIYRYLQQKDNEKSPQLNNIPPDNDVESDSSEDSFTSSGLDKNRSYKVGSTVFVGRPDLYLSEPPKCGQLSCLVLTSKWSYSVIPEPSKNEADEAIDYCRVAGYHEQHVLESADYRCAVCSDLVPARSLVHRPIAFVRTKGKFDDSIRPFVTRFSPFIGCRWTFPEMNVALGRGEDVDAQMVDFAVPICEGGTICERVARSAAKRFVKLLFPQDMRLKFLGLDPDTDLCLIDDEVFEDDRSDLVIDRTPELLVRKVGSKGMLTEREDRGEDPMSDELTITKLRHWYESVYQERKRKRQYLGAIDNKCYDGHSKAEGEEGGVNESGTSDRSELSPVSSSSTAKQDNQLERQTHP